MDFLHWELLRTLLSSSAEDRAEDLVKMLRNALGHTGFTTTQNIYIVDCLLIYLTPVVFGSQQGNPLVDQLPSVGSRVRRNSQAWEVCPKEFPSVRANSQASEMLASVSQASEMLASDFQASEMLASEFQASEMLASEFQAATQCSQAISKRQPLAQTAMPDYLKYTTKSHTFKDLKFGSRG